ncbi:MAG: prepilin-type N-terminal cleavage/methylation domain-containing protein [Candidatus Omnitrophota bacterium]|jgi:type II secretion system protein G|nr:MAG: prepilin-type N-terminal cleavage/methylation domain-containing protein [Candidatus Omnitrophota bacterium]
MCGKTASAFTLIELLIVVAIIGVLAAIAVPNFLNARVRAMIAKVEGEFQTMATALEMYKIDRGKYPPFVDPSGVNINPVNRRLIPLTTPVAYLASVPQDPFLETRYGERVVTNQHEAYVTYDYVDAWTIIHNAKRAVVGASLRCCEWQISSAGPDYDAETYGTAPTWNATNGLTSRGDMLKLGPPTSFPCDPSLIGI